VHLYRHTLKISRATKGAGNSGSADSLRRRPVHEQAYKKKNYLKI
jgi:hypothetical protein